MGGRGDIDSTFLNAYADGRGWLAIFEATNPCSALLCVGIGQERKVSIGPSGRWKAKDK